MNRWRRLLHDAAQLRHRRWLRWMGPALHHPRLWHMSRRGVSLGVGVGVFFGLMLPLAQMPAAAVVAVLVRANVPVAAVSTLVTNPVTFPAIYYGAYRIGSRLIGQDPQRRDAFDHPPEQLQEAVEQPPPRAWWRRVGIPTAVGLAVMATTCGLLTYLLAGWLLRLRTQRIWDRRVRRRRRRNSSQH